MKNDTIKRVGIWIRVSTEDQARGESPEHHELRARHYAEAKGWTVATVYHLEAVSGKTVKEHPEAKRMMADVRDGQIQGLIFSKLARLARNTKELLDFGDYFRQHDAELISLGESIDTSTPAGRLFYTIIAAMATWERDEIAARVSASIPIRAQLGKSLGGSAPFGYAWVDGKLVIDEKEAPIRREMYDLFLEHQRFRTVARIMSSRGYRTRSGAEFKDSGIRRLVVDPIAKGMRRMNYSSAAIGSNGRYVPKPEELWLNIPAPALIDEDKWNQVQAVYTSVTSGEVKKSKRVVNLFSGVIHCYCGRKMYVPSNSPKYTCDHCRNKIPLSDMEAVFQEQLKEFFFSPEEIAKHLAIATSAIADKGRLLASQEKELKSAVGQIDKLHDLYQSGAIDKAGFSQKYFPLAARKTELESELPALQAEVDALKIAQLSHEEIVVGARDLYSRWSSLAHQDKRRIIEAITERIVVGTDDITIDLLYRPEGKLGEGGSGGGSGLGGGSGSPSASPLNRGKSATNPCPDGYLGANLAARPCRCTPDQIARYRGKLSGPLLDRIDLQITVPALASESLRAAPDGEPSAAVRQRVVAASERQLARQGKTNADLSPVDIDQHCALDEHGEQLMRQAAARMGLSARAQHRICRVARTVADLAGAERIGVAHLAEAIGYRRMES